MSVVINAPDLANQLSSIASDDYSAASDIAKNIQDYTDALNDGKINSTEYKDLLLDIDIEKMVVKSATDQQLKVALSSIVEQLLGFIGDIRL
jgi:hypothetical protein